MQPVTVLNEVLDALIKDEKVKTVPYNGKWEFHMICLKLFKFSFFFMLFPLLLIVLLNFLEAGISFLQAYVFYVLMILYFKESYYLAH